MSIQDKFLDATTRIRVLPTASPEVMLKLYGLYKQGTSGDALGDRPGMLDMRARAKFDAWVSRKGMTLEDAQEEYIDVVDELLG